MLDAWSLEKDRRIESRVAMMIRRYLGCGSPRKQFNRVGLDDLKLVRF